MKFIPLVALIFFSTITFGQQSIKVIDIETGDPIPGVLVEILDQSSTQVEGSITDIDGIARFDLNGNYKAKVSHVSYNETIIKIITGDQVIKISPATTTLNDVVVTGQYHPQSAEKSVYNVKTVGAETIQDQGSVQLHEVLSKQLNIRVSPDLAIGSNSMSLQGIPGKNVKILVDGVPLINRNGNGNNADLSQINMSNIERVEIVEGPMSVDYGANALAGVINLITKTPKKKSYRVGLDIQGETINQQYGIDDGNTNINLTSAVSLSEAFMFSLNGGLTRFGGFQGEEEGREYQWNPKDQVFYDAGVWYQSDKFSINYKFDQLFEKIVDTGPLQTDIQFSTGAERDYAFDADYKSRRTGHQIQANGKLSEFFRFNFITSYADFDRDVEKYRLWLATEERDISSIETTTYNAGIFRGTVQNINPKKSINYQFGVDVNIESTTGGRIAGDTTQNMQDYAAFISFEARIKQLAIRPGLRGSYNSVFESWLTPSVNLKYHFSDQISLSAAYGNGYRAPSLRELYMEFIDASHTVIGNEDLTPEYSNHYSMNFDYKTPVWNGLLTTKSQIFYNNIKDLISFKYDPDDPTYAKYFNLNKLETLGFNLSESYEGRNFNIEVGAGVIGMNEDDPQVETPDEFFYSPEANVNVNYIESKSKIKFNVFYKYNGQTSQYLFDENDELVIGRLDGYGLLDLTLNRTFQKYITLGVGVKNLLDVTDLTTNSSTSGGAIHGSSARTIGYGRSFFFRLSLNLDSTNN